MWDDGVYKRAIKFIHISFVGLIIFWAGMGFHSIPLAVFGALFAVGFSGTGASLILRVVWTEDENSENF